MKNLVKLSIFAIALGFFASCGETKEETPAAEAPATEATTPAPAETAAAPAADTTAPAAAPAADTTKH
ncbi:MAG TPA: hypothetical protein PLP34_01550 [Chitinophagaceae bacterium]|nr:hypothetical protein [Chitinophagaceae bacterium]HNF71063.1 hypothetical protein [Chitinophagaceae bacterium]